MYDVVRFLVLHAQELSVGAPMPSFKLNSTVYGKVNSADLKGKVVLISMFATWCGPCQLELAEVEKTLWPKYKDNKDFVLLVIGREHTDADLTKYNERKKFSFPLYPDPKREVFRFLQRRPSLVYTCLERTASCCTRPLVTRKKTLIT